MHLVHKKAVFFDFGDTLASTNPPFLQRIAMALREAGMNITDSEFEHAYHRADYELYKKHINKGGITPDEHRKWFFPLLYEHLEEFRDKSVDVAELRSRVRVEMSKISFTREVLPGAKGLLSFLKQEGFVVAIISNNDGRTAQKCDEVGIRDFFDLILDSTELGLIKPDERIFRFALERLDIAAGDAVHIGDLYGADILGGLNAGLDVVWMNKRGVDRLDESDFLESKNLDDVKAFFGLGNTDT